jgi:hypothetical protein
MESFIALNDLELEAILGRPSPPGYLYTQAKGHMFQSLVIFIP